ncbi:MAG TPA: hypothetical protein VKT82_17885 [Ktedonobacterales bacterium]|nr:hypothetical protein [Ktedonobacterales bacterium]
MADSLNPFDDERFHDISAAAHADAEDLSAADETLAKDEQDSGTIGSNGYHAFSGPLSPVGAPSTLRAPGKQSKQHTMLPVILAIIGVVVILSCLGVGAAVTVNLLSIQTSLNSPQATVDDFYSALHVKDYQTAYDQLSSGYQSRLTQSSFRATFELIGTIESYQVSNVQTQSSQASATVKVTLVAPDGGTVNETKTVQLVQENGNWKINSVTPSLTRAIWFVGQQGLTLDWG